MATGADLVNQVWTAIGVVVVFAATILIIVKNFMGQERNVPRGIGLLIGVAVVAFLASKPEILLGIGETIAGLVTKGSS